MPERYSTSLLAAVGTTLLPSSSLYAGANKDVRLMELHAFNDTASACKYLLARLDTAGTKGAAQVDAAYGRVAQVSEAEVFAVHTVGPTIDEVFERMPFGAAIGAGFILTFGKEGLLIPAGIGNGIGMILIGGVGQQLETTYVWEV